MNSKLDKLFYFLYTIEKIIMSYTQNLIFPIVVKSNYLTNLGLLSCSKKVVHFIAGIIITLISLLTCNLFNIKFVYSIVISLLVLSFFGTLKELVDRKSNMGQPSPLDATITFIGGFSVILISILIHLM